MKITTRLSRGGVKAFLISLFFLFTSSFIFAQNVKPYVVDLSKMPVVNDDKTATFDKVTKTVTVTANDKLQYGGNKGIYLWLNNLDISSYNIARVKYKVIGDYGFHFTLNYDDNTLDWNNDKTTYCPSYLNEMLIPLKSNQRRLHGIAVTGTWNVPYEQFVIESITLEKVANPQKTDVCACDEPPVIDISTNETIDKNLNAWDFVKKLGAGFQYMVFVSYPNEQEFGTDIFSLAAFSKPTKEQIHFIKEKGFKTIRFQTNPGHGHILDKDYTVSPRYIKAIKQVVDWCIEEDMNVILCGPFAEHTQVEWYKKKIEAGNVHYAGYYVNEKYKEESERFIKAVWKQYAEAFNNSYDEHLIFETFNEPFDVFDEHGFDPKGDCATCKKDYAILNEYNQLIVDTIRSTGGNNASRFIMINGIGSRWSTITDKNFKLPKDKTKNKLIPTYHHYPMGGSAASDYPFDYYTNGIKDSIAESFAALDKAYFSKHIPVYLGETGQSRHTPVLERIKMINDIMTEVSKPNRSCAALLHVDGDLTGADASGWFSGYYDSWKLKWYDEELVDTFIYGAQGKEYPLSSDFIKKNEIKIESIVGKNLLKKPVERTGKVNWDNNYMIKSGSFYRSTPIKYKIEFEIEKTGADPFLNFAYTDFKGNWHDGYNTPLLKSMRVKGGVMDGIIKVQADTVVLEINEKLANELVNGEAVYLNGQNIIIKSMKVIE